jgi:hypothetical protein
MLQRNTHSKAMHLQCADAAHQHPKVHSMQNAQCKQGDRLLQVPLQEPRQDLLAGGKALTRDQFRDMGRCGLIE